MSKNSILKTLAYFDIFDYPLSASEISQYSEVTISKEDQARNSLQVGKYKGFYFLKNRKEIVMLRKQRQIISRKKMLTAKNVSQVLLKIPSVCLIGVSGTLAMNNCQEDDDIDLFVITKKGTLWTTRLLLLLILQLLGVRRKRNELNASNKICLNMVVDENELTLSKKRQNLYGAHEIIQLIPLFERANTYNRFIIANNWIFRFLPNSKLKKVLVSKRNSYLGSILNLIEPFSKFLQKKLMGVITKEEISQNLLAFHPTDYQNLVLQKYKKKLQALI